MPTIPFGGDPEVMVSEPGALIVRDISRSPGRRVGGFPESVQVNTKTRAAAGVDGVPVIIPLLALRLKPAGSAPEVIDHVKGGVPPCTKFMRLSEKGRPALTDCCCTGGGLTKDSAGLTVTRTDFDRVESAMDEAVKVTVSDEVTLVGAMYLFGVPLAVLLCSMAPHVFTPAGQVTVQLTP